MLLKVVPARQITFTPSIHSCSGQHVNSILLGDDCLTLIENVTHFSDHLKHSQMQEDQILNIPLLSWLNNY